MIIAFAMVGLLAFVLTCLAIIAPNSGRFLPAIRATPKPRHEVSLAPNDHTAALPRYGVVGIHDVLQEELMKPSSPTYAELSRRFTQPIDKFCKSLGALRVGKFATMGNPVADGQWVCISDILQVPGSGASSNTSSVFVWIRGTERREVDLVRVKINLTDPVTSEAAKNLAINLIEKLHALAGWDMPAALSNAVHDGSDASFDRYGLSYQVTREWSSVPRLNVVLYSNDRSGIVPIDSFKGDSVALNSP